MGACRVSPAIYHFCKDIDCGDPTLVRLNAPSALLFYMDLPYVSHPRIRPTQTRLDSPS